MIEGPTTGELRARVLAVKACPHGIYPPAPFEAPIMFAGPITGCPCCRHAYGFKPIDDLCQYCRTNGVAA